MKHDQLEQRIARWVATAPAAVAHVMSFLGRFLPDVAADVGQALARGGRLRVVLDLEAGTVSRFRVRLLRPDPDPEVNRTVYTWRRSAGPED